MEGWAKVWGVWGLWAKNGGVWPVWAKSEKVAMSAFLWAKV